jgi:hypothetical protein
MPPSGDDPEISILDARLAEIDRRLHSIQTDLVEEHPPAASPPRIAVPGDHPRPAAVSGTGPMRQLLAAAQRRADAARSPEGASPVGVRAGPFSTTEALWSFRAALETLPGVRAVELRGFEGADRAILDIHL